MRDAEDAARSRSHRIDDTEIGIDFFFSPPSLLQFHFQCFLPFLLLLFLLRLGVGLFVYGSVRWFYWKPKRRQKRLISTLPSNQSSSTSPSSSNRIRINSVSKQNPSQINNKNSSSSSSSSSGSGNNNNNNNNSHRQAAFSWSGPSSISSTGMNCGVPDRFQRWGSGRASYHSACPSPSPSGTSSSASAYRSSLLTTRTPYLG